MCSVRAALFVGDSNSILILVDLSITAKIDKNLVKWNQLCCEDLDPVIFLVIQDIAEDKLTPTL